MPNDSFAAPCWLELDGQPYLEARDPRPAFATFFRIPRDRSPAPGLPGQQ
jgi:hypothetical protein